MEDIVIRELQINDYHKGFLKLLSQLTIVNLDCSFDEFKEQFNKITSKVFVIIKDNNIIGTGSIFIENKFIRNFSSVAHIEDVVIDKQYRGYGYGRVIIDKLIEYSRNQNVYKIILDCNEENISFYEKCGLLMKGVQMAKYLKD